MKHIESIDPSVCVCALIQTILKVGAFILKVRIQNEKSTRKTVK